MLRQVSSGTFLGMETEEDLEPLWSPAAFRAHLALRSMTAEDLAEKLQMAWDSAPEEPDSRRPTLHMVYHWRKNEAPEPRGQWIRRELSRILRIPQKELWRS